MARKTNPQARAAASGFTIVEVVVVAAVTLFVLASFVTLFRMGQGAFRSGPETAALRLDASAMLDFIARDLERAGSGLPPEIPVFNNLDRAGNRNPDGLDFLAAPARLVGIGFEPVTSFDGANARLGVPASRLDASARPFAVVFNDDEMMPRWAFGEVASVASAGGGLAGSVSQGLNRVVGDSGSPPPEGARVGLRPVRNDWHYHFRSVDADTFAPGGGGGLMQRALKSVLGGVIDAALPGLGSGPAAALTDQVVSSMLETLAERAQKAGKSLGKKGGLPVGGIGDEPAERYGLFGLGQPGVVPVSRIRYWLRPPGPRDGGRRTLMRRVDEGQPQPVGFADDLQIRYVTGRDADRLLDDPPAFLGDMQTAAALGDHIVRAVEVEIRAASSAAAWRAPDGDGAAPRTTIVRRRVGLRIAAAGVGRRAWEESMQRNALPTEIPRIGPLRFIKLPW